MHSYSKSKFNYSGVFLQLDFKQPMYLMILYLNEYLQYVAVIIFQTLDIYIDS